MVAHLGFLPSVIIAAVSFAVVQLQAGYVVMVDGMNGGSGCSGPGEAVPNIGNAYDLNRLTQCIIHTLARGRLWVSAHDQSKFDYAATLHTNAWST